MPGGPAYIATAKAPDGRYVLAGLDTAGGEQFRLPLPARGHAGAAHPHRAEAVAFARRPGDYALVIDVASGHVRHELAPPEGRRFNGHGAYVADGATLLTVEQMADGSEGRIEVWDVEAGYLRRGEFASHGIGPHDLRLMPAGHTPVVANGGIQTDPTDRTKLNIPAMQPSLTHLTRAGDLLEEVRLDDDLRRNSIRHRRAEG